MDRDTLRVGATFLIALVGILVVLAVFNMTRKHAHNKEEGTFVISIAGTAISMIGTLVGFVAGQAAGASGKESAERRAESATERALSAERRASLLSGLVSPELYKEYVATHADVVTDG